MKKRQIEIVSPNRPVCKNLKTFSTQRSLFQPTNMPVIKKETKRIITRHQTNNLSDSAPKEYFKKPMG